MADPILNKRGMTELHLASYHGELDWVQNCLRGGLSVHARDHRGYTPLHWKADMGLTGDLAQREAIVDTLIAAGADVNAHDHEGLSVLRIARRAEAQEIAHLLVAAGAVEA